MPNLYLARATHLLGVSVWYLLDLTDERDGGGARPQAAHEEVRELWGMAKDPDKAAPLELLESYENRRTGRRVERIDGDPWPEGTAEGDWEFRGAEREGVIAWRVSLRGTRITRTRELHDAWSIQDGMDELLANPIDWEGEAYEGADEAAEGWESYLRWYRQRLTDRMRDDLLKLRGDFRDPLAVIRAELENARTRLGSADLDALLRRIDGDARESLG
jgi:hypothetical protein